jgi:hypothetical protein
MQICLLKTTLHIVFDSNHLLSFDGVPPCLDMVYNVCGHALTDSYTLSYFNPGRRFTSSFIHKYSCEYSNLFSAQLVDTFG